MASHKAKPQPPRGIPLDRFLRKIDYAAQIRDGISTLLLDTLMREHDFRAALGVPADKFRRAVETGNFDRNQVRHSGNIYWGSEKNVAKVRQMQEAYQ